MVVVKELELGNKPSVVGGLADTALRTTRLAAAATCPQVKQQNTLTNQRTGQYKMAY